MRTRLRSRESHRCFPGPAAACAVLLGLFGVDAPVACGQVFRAAPAEEVERGADASEQPANPGGFQFQLQEELATAFSDFERYSRRQNWEKAFRALSEIPADKRSGMLQSSDGLIVPGEQRIWEAVVNLPAEGREAFRIFFDAKARQLSRSADSDSQPGTDVAAARVIFDEYFLTSVGDEAANVLGDAAFEQGRFREAERYWKAILDHHSDSDISELRLQFKRAVALAMSRRTSAFRTILKEITERYAAEKVTVGGREVDPVEYLKALESGLASEVADGASPGAQRDPVPTGVLADGTEPVWRIRFFSEQGKKQLESAVSNYYWYRNGMETLVPPFATDGERMFCNWFGIVFALDARTGKLLWRSEKFDKVHGAFGNMPYANSNISQYDIAAGGGVVLSIVLPADRLNYYREPFRLKAYDAQSGKEKWDTQKIKELNTESFVGKPLVVDDTVLVTSHGREDAKLKLRCFRLNDGTLLWTHELGTAQKVSNTRGEQDMPLPMLYQNGRTLYILTNNGALIAFDLPQQKVEWALRYESAGSVPENMRYSGQIADHVALHSYGCILEHDGLLYLKEGGGSELMAVDPDTPAVLWKRPIAAEAVLTGVDDDHLYLLSRELMAVDRNSRGLKWSKRLPIIGGGLSVVQGEDSLYVFSKRGIYAIGKESGDLRSIFRGVDLDSNGGWIDLIGERLVCVSNLAVTAYPLPGSDAEPAGGSGP